MKVVINKYLLFRQQCNYWFTVWSDKSTKWVGIQNYLQWQWNR